ncbi:hypothetical protein M407DRAFT_69180 [Tulasnella calospora MUT 4182]|uniref:Integrase core domain-containing protein n=1 Tax=Tulasnella calospora MUT 4182 TaxID=1051891 RepID=A0A0C3QFX2_9AGAM|nr:hypothetical protein M407DRAFT_69180 [Tulasnella calospora MUT 4182]
MTIFKQRHPDAGNKFALAFVKRFGLRIPQQRIFKSLERVNKAARKIRQSQGINRRVYRVSRPNYLWHMDGYHKLIRYGFVIHGIIDGYCRTVWSNSLLHPCYDLI